MPDLLTHVLLAYVGGSLLIRASARFSPRYVPVAMVGAVLPDAAKVGLVIPASSIEAAVGLPFSYGPIHAAGGAVVLAGLGAMTVSAPHRRLAFLALGGGAFFHLLLDLLVVRASGRAPPYLYPLTWWHPPSGDLLLSSDPWPAAVAGVAAAAVWLHGRRRD